MSKSDQIEIINFKSIHEFNLELRPLNVLIGPNGVGKSNFIGAFWTLLLILAKNLFPLSQTISGIPRPGMAAGIRTFQKDFGERSTTGFFIHPGDVSLPSSPNVRALPFACL